MFEQWFVELTLRHALVSLLIVVVFVSFAWAFRFWGIKTARQLILKTGKELYKTIFRVIEKPLIAIIVLAGLQLSILFLPLKPALSEPITKFLLTVMSLLGIYVGTALLNAVIKWYMQEVLSKKEEAGFSRRLLNVFRVAMIVVALLAGVLVTLGIWNVSSAPVTEWISAHGWRIALIVVLLIVVIIVIGGFVPKVVISSLARRAGESEEEVRKRGVTLSRVLVGTGQVVAIFIAAFMVLSELDINIAPILAGVGVVGLAIGFGAQSLVKDVLAGVFIILENHYGVGDVVRIADVAGLVEDINLRRTVLRDLDGIVHVVPNGEIRVASNFTRGWSRVNLNISVAYGEDLDHVISVINRVGKELAEDPQWSEAVIKPPAVLRVDKLGDSGIEIKILGDTKPLRQWDVMGELRLRLKKAFDKEGIEIPWPHTKVYFGNFPFPETSLNRDKEKS